MFRVVMLGGIIALALPVWAEDVPLEKCGPLIAVHASAETSAGVKPLLLLIDTGATTILNLKSFEKDGEPRKVDITSWNNTTSTDAREVKLTDFVIGEHHLKKLALPAVDLSPMGRMCGKKLDGILGTDLLEQLGAVVDFKERVARLASSGKDAPEQLAEFNRQREACGQAFERADETALADCLDPQFVLLTTNGEYYGRDAAMAYFRKHYFHQAPLPHLTLKPRAYHSLGDAVWLEYDLSVTMKEQPIEARGTALYRKTGEKWRLLNMNHSARRPDNECVGNANDPICDKTITDSYGDSASTRPF